MKNIKEVEKFLKDKYLVQEGDFSRFGPAHKAPHYDDIVMQSKNNERSLYIKGFSTSGLKDGKAEVEMIKLFNSFQKNNKGLFTGPEIIAVLQNPFHFEMEELHNPIDFGLLSQGELNGIFEEYRQEFDEFEKFSNGKITSPKMENKILQGIQQIKKLENKISIIKKGIIEVIKIKQIRSLTNWISNSKNIGLVEESIPGFSCKAQEEFLKGFNALSNISFEYNFGRLWTGHVFGNSKKGYGLVDFDNVGYQIKGSELLGIIWSNTLLNCNNFVTYNSFKESFDYRYEKLHTQLDDVYLANHMIKMKLLGTIFADYGHLMNTEEGNTKKITNVGKNVKEHNIQGIQRNYQLLIDYFPEFTT